MNILLTAVGRRPYLVQWFQDALQSAGLPGKVIAADLDAHAPARAFADDFLQAPRADSDEYLKWLEDVLESEAISLAVSINDFELSTWSRLPQGTPWDVLVRLDEQTQNTVEDKVVMNQVLSDAGIPTPKTWVGSQAAQAVTAHDGDFITKGRFGSASRGLRFTNGKGLAETIQDAVSEVTDRNGMPALQQDSFAADDLVLVQERIDGTEYGVDVISDLNGKYAGVAAREKIAMRAGETDRAVSVSPEMFESVAKHLSEAVRHQGTMDVDIIVDSEGTPYVIDINPRFGGGYPFSHLAGADVPSAYVAWASGATPPREWCDTKPGVTAGKYVGIAAS